MALSLVATCVLGLEEILEGELHTLGARGITREKGAVTFSGTWEDCWRANWRLRTANRVLVELGTWNGRDGAELAAGARAIVGWGAPGTLLHPDHSFAIQATCTASTIRDARWVRLILLQRGGDIADRARGRREARLLLELGLDLAGLLYRDSGTLVLLATA